MQEPNGCSEKACAMLDAKEFAAQAEAAAAVGGVYFLFPLQGTNGIIMPVAGR